MHARMHGMCSLDLVPSPWPLLTLGCCFVSLYRAPASALTATSSPGRSGGSAWASTTGSQERRKEVHPALACVNERAGPQQVCVAPPSASSQL